MARYMLLIHGEEAGWEAAGDDERAAMYERCGAVVATMRERGHLIEAAVATATAIPGASTGAVEVRPVVASPSS